jgi:rhodanese-related sulfurtransferase
MKVMNWRTFLLRTTVFVIASVLIGLLYNTVISRDGIGLYQSPLQATSGLNEARFIGLDGAEQRWRRGAVFLDARHEDFYTYEGHIKGALSLPFEDFEVGFARVKDRLPSKDAELVCYCSGYGCEESAEIAKLLMERGYSRVFIYEGGWPEWTAAELPVEMPSERLE